MKILVIEDEKKVAKFIKIGLEEERYSVDNAYDGKEGLDMALSNHYDAILLDIMLPEMSGYKVLEELRAAHRNLPVLLITALNTTQDKVNGLDLGADDYISKPFVLDELTARLRAILRRTTDTHSTKMQCGELILDSVSHIAYRNEREIELTTKEYSLLEFLMRNKNKIVSRSTITQHVWRQDYDPESNIIDVYIKRLRTKIDGESEKKPMIQSIRGVGYRLKEQTL